MSPVNSTSKLFALSGALLLVLSACGGGGGGIDNPYPGDPPFVGAGVPYLQLPFLYGSLSDGTYRIGAVPDAGKVARTAIDFGSNNEMSFSYQAQIGGGTVLKSHISNLVVWKNQRLVRQDLLAQYTIAAPKQLSTLSSAQVCGGEVESDRPADYPRIGADLNDASKSWRVFSKAGADATCNTADDSFVAVRLDMAPGDAPRDIARPVVAIHAANGALTGWLVRNGQVIQRVGADFTNPVTMFTLPGANMDLNNHDGYLGNILIFGSGGMLYAATLDSPGLQVPTLVAPLNLEYLNSIHYPDANSVIVAIGGTSPTDYTRFVRYTIGTRVTTPLGTVPYFTGVINLTPSRIVTSGEGRMDAVPLAGGAATPIAQAAGAQLWIAAKSGERLWKQVGSSVISVNSDGSAALTIPDAKVAGCLYQAASAGPLFEPRECKGVFVVKGNVAQVYNADTGSLRRSFGSVVPAVAPRTSSYNVSYAAEWGQGVVLSQFIFNADNSPVSTSAYYIRSDEDGLTPLTLP